MSREVLGPDLDAGSHGDRNAQTVSPPEGLSIQVSELPEITEGATLWLRDHLGEIKTKIVLYAKEIAQHEHENENAPIAARHVAAAALVFAPGKPIQAQPVDYENENAFWRRMGLSITGVTLVAGLLAIVFGLIGLAVKGNESLATGAWDIAKIFAGAVVGSTTTAAVSSKKGR